MEHLKSDPVYIHHVSRDGSHSSRRTDPAYDRQSAFEVFLLHCIVQQEASTCEGLPWAGVNFLLEHELAADEAWARGTPLHPITSRRPATTSSCLGVLSWVPRHVLTQATCASLSTVYSQRAWYRGGQIAGLQQGCALARRLSFDTNGSMWTTEYGWQLRMLLAWQRLVRAGKVTQARRGSSVALARCRGQTAKRDGTHSVGGGHAEQKGTSGGLCMEG